MLKTYPVHKLSVEEGGEYVLGLKDLDTHACYLIYGELNPGEERRKVCPGRGHEEILLAVNGAIYNAAELRSRYGRFAFQSQSDSETVLPLYLDRGIEGLADLEGMFAIAIYDGRTGSRPGR